jgi:hypothetical protein
VYSRWGGSTSGERRVEASTVKRRRHCGSARGRLLQQYCTVGEYVNDHPLIHCRHVVIIGVGGFQAEARHHSIHSYRYQTPLSTSFTLCNALPHPAIGQSAAVLWLQSRRNNHGFRKPTAPVPDWLSHTRTLSLSLTRSSTRAESG